MQFTGTNDYGRRGYDHSAYTRMWKLKRRGVALMTPDGRVHGYLVRGIKLYTADGRRFA